MEWKQVPDWGARGPAHGMWYQTWMGVLDMAGVPDDKWDMR